MLLFQSIAYLLLTHVECSASNLHIFAINKCGRPIQRLLLGKRNEHFEKVQ